MGIFLQEPVWCELEVHIDHLMPAKHQNMFYKNIIFRHQLLCFHRSKRLICHLRLTNLWSCQARLIEQVSIIDYYHIPSCISYGFHSLESCRHIDAFSNNQATFSSLTTVQRSIKYIWRFALYNKFYPSMYIHLSWLE